MAWEAEITAAIIAATGSAGVAIFSYLYTRNKEIKTNIHLKRLDKYDNLLNALTNFVNDTSNPSTRYTLILAYYAAGAYANEQVLKACYSLLKSVEASPPPQTWKIDEVMIGKIYNSIRQDVIPDARSFPFKAYHVKPTGEVRP